ncbi:MAG: hypothetical protein FWG82_03255, partial [Oscillospiraceae bacterium]|nr:hypothetical protein [Oscillospiraceae bacterium]
QDLGEYFSSGKEKSAGILSYCEHFGRRQMENAPQRPVEFQVRRLHYENGRQIAARFGYNTQPYPVDSF